MGRTTSKKIGLSSSVQSIAESYLSMAQDLTQTASVQQIASINCGTTDKGGSCMSCTKLYMETLNKFPVDSISTLQEKSDYIKKSCKTSCVCEISNLNMEQNININYATFAGNSTSESFVTNVRNSVTQKASSNKQSFVTSPPNKMNTFETTIQKIYKRMKSKTMQKSLQSLQAHQNFTMTGAGKSANISQKQAMKVVSSILMLDKQMASLITELEANVLELSVMVANAGLAEMAMWLVKLIMMVVILVVLLYIITLIFQIYTLYAV
jgi:hypothetical protein